MTTTTTPMNDRNVAYFTISRKDAARLIRDLATAIAESDFGSIDMEFRTERRDDFSKTESTMVHEIRFGLRNSFSNITGTITESATWE